MRTQKVTFPDGTVQTTAATASVPSGAITNFANAAAPTGWTQVTTYNNYALRIVNGTALYTSTFTLPTSYLTAVTNTILLACQSSTFVDTSTNAWTITLSGTPYVSNNIPYSIIYSNSGLPVSKLFSNGSLQITNVFDETR